MNTSASALRRKNDQKLLSDLIERSAGSLASEGVLNTEADRVTLILKLPTALSADYPNHGQSHCRISLVFPLRYPFEAPTAKVLTAIWHPNVFPNGNVCLGSRWQASEGIDLFVARVARLLIFDPLLVNLQSMANQSAGAWYARTIKTHPNAFPSVQAQVTHWLRDPRGQNQAIERVALACPSCSSTLRLPVGRSGVVQCPRCRHEFEANT
jgi:ubiquitin-protein ligase